MHAYQRKHILLFELVEYFRELAKVKDFVDDGRLLNKMK
jgi:hypothetical protein